MSKWRHVRYLFAAVIWLAATTAARADFSGTTPVPINRLIANLQNQELRAKNDNEKAKLDFQIARAHAAAFVRGNDDSTIQFPSGRQWGIIDTSGHFEDWPDFRQLGEEKNPVRSPHSLTHLNEAIKCFSQAIQLNPKLAEAKLGLAWCSMKIGHKTEAIRLFREIIAAGDSVQPSYPGVNITMEATQYLMPLLDPKQDAAEISRLSLIPKPRYHQGLSPIVVPIQLDIPVSDLMQSADVAFDLGVGQQRFSSWPSHHAGWLVYEPTLQSRITSGQQLFGNFTFWILWEHGYQAMSALDDNQDGKLDGAELNGLAIWQDLNQDGKSDRSELRTLSEWGIVSLSCSCETAENGFWFSPQGVTFASGQTASTYDWILQGK